MGALAPSQLWITEDDLILKNAIEAGASLESLAKGAVQFSREFSVQELQERWRSLLFDKDTSEEFSTRVVEIEFSASNCLKIQGTFSSKGLQAQSRKRRRESLRHHYNARRKRIRNEPSSYMSLDFDVSPGNCVFLGDGNFDVKRAMPEQLLHNCFSDSLILYNNVPETQFSIEQYEYAENLGVDHDFADADGVNDGSNILYHMDPPQDGFDQHNFSGDDTYKHVDDIGFVSEEMRLGRNVDQSFEEMSEIGDISQMLEEEMRILHDKSGVQAPQMLEHANISGDNCLQTKPLYTANIVHNSNEKVSSGFEQNQSPIPCALDCSDSFTQTACLSPLHAAPTLDLPFVCKLEDKENGSSNPVMTHDGKRIVEPECEEGPLVPDLVDSIIDAGVASEEDFAVSLKFSNEEETFPSDRDENFAIDRTSFESLNTFLMDSPVNQHHDDISKTNDCNSGIITNECVNHHIVHGEESHDFDTKVLPSPENENVDFGSTSIIPTVPSKIPFSCKPLEKDPCCILNTEDPEIPCNDDFLSVTMGQSLNTSSDMKPCFVANPVGSSNEVVLNDMELNVSNMAKENRDTSTHGSLLKMVKMEFPQGIQGQAGEEFSDVKPSCMNLDESSKIEEVAVDDFEDTEFADPTHSSSTSDKEDKYSESEDDPPTFSDVEALILDICLEADDQESPIYTSEVSRYRHLDSKKAIIRLEQGAYSYMQRAISCNGAFAVFYGHHLKHYIRKDKVLIGRSTRELEVDIDLGKEAQSNKISRRQAMIEMDDDGSFLFINMGKCPMSINGKELLRGKRCNLSSGCLIQIRSMAFTFEINSNSVKQYLSTASRKKTAMTSSVFNWLPGEIT